MSKFLLVCSFYNNPEEHIDLTFDNVLKQTHQDWILIVGDDFSTVPGFRNLLKRKVEQINDPRIIYYDIKSKRELYLYQNTFQELNYDYYFDLDSDDIIHKRILELYHNNFTQYPEVTSIFSDFVKVSEHGVKQQYSVVRPPKDYIKEFQFRNNNSFEEIYSKREGQQMFGVARCMRKPNKIHIEKNCRTSTDSLFLFYNLNRGKHLHLPRRLYTYIKRDGSDSGTMPPSEYIDFNMNANYYVNQSPLPNDFDPYASVWYETSALSTCDFLSQVKSVSLISNINKEQFNLIKSLYPDKQLELNNLDNPNLIVVWDNLPSDLETQFKKIANQAENLSICKFNDDFTLEAGLPHNGSNTNITDNFLLLNNNFAQSLSEFISNYTWWSYFRFVIITKSNLGSINFLPQIQKNNSILDNINFNFINGATVEIKGDSNKNYIVKFINDDTKELIWQDSISSNMWTKTNRAFYTKWRLEIWDSEDLVFHHVLNLNQQRVYINLDSKSLGDTIAWFPYIEEFRKKHNCTVICSTFRNHFFKSLYPDIQFVTPGETVHGIYAQYSIGWFFDSNKNPNNVITIPLQQAATDILGLPYKEIKPKIDVKTSPTPINGKYVTLAIQSTSQAKYWNYKEGWDKVVKYLNKKGYKVVTIDQHAHFGVNGCMNSIPKNTIDKTGCSFDEAATLIKGADAHLGLSSGLSWLAWALGTHVVMVSSFSNPICEFTTDITRIYKDTPYSGYYNNPNFKFDPKNWHWNPFLDISTPEEWHDFETITPEQVIDAVDTYLTNNALYTTQKILINIISNSLGDTLGCVPYVDKYQQDTQNQVSLKCNSLLKPYLIKAYPNLNFVVEDHHHYDNIINLDYNFNLPLQKGYAQQLGYSGDKYLKPRLDFTPSDNSMDRKYVVFGVHSTAQLKYWNHPKGKSVQPSSPYWVELAKSFRKENYLPLMVEKDETFGVSPLFNGVSSAVVKKIGLPFNEVLNFIYHSEFYIGLSSGLSWVAHALGKKVVMIANFTEEWNEFDINDPTYLRINNKSVCHGCFNKINQKYSKEEFISDWYWCPEHKKTSREFECHKSITPQMVFNQIKEKNWI